MTLEELKEKLDEEYNELVSRGLKWSVEHDENESEYFLAHAYEFAHFNEIKDFFEFLEEDEWDINWRELFNKLSPNKNILEGIYHDWLSYAHPENFNFFCYEDLVSIIKYWLKHN